MTEEFPRKLSFSGTAVERRPSLDASKFRCRTSSLKLRVDVGLARGGDPRGDETDGRTVRHRYEGPTQQEVVEQGRELFQNFLVEELQSRGLEEHVGLVSPNRSSPRTGRLVKNPVWVKAGRDLREMADAFSRTKERQRLRNRAQRRTVFAFLLELFDWASVIFWVTKGTLRLTSHVTEAGLTSSSSTLRQRQG